jgi:hypothetical protein
MPRKATRLTRRIFVKQRVGGIAAYAAYSLLPANRALGANDRVRFGLIGAGGRGQEIFKAARGCAQIANSAPAPR